MYKKKHSKNSKIFYSVKCPPNIEFPSILHQMNLVPFSYYCKMYHSLLKKLKFLKNVYAVSCNWSEIKSPSI